MASAYQRTSQKQGFQPPDPFTESDVEYYVTRQLEGFRRAGAEWRGPCPIHKGKNDSFAISAATGLWTCHSKCGEGGNLPELEAKLSNTTVKKANERLRDLLNKLTSAPIRSGNGAAKIKREEPRFREVAAYEYTDRISKVLYRIVRQERSDPSGVREKKFVAQRLDSSTGRWKFGMGDAPCVLFNLPAVVAADRVFIVEGEKCALAIATLGLVGTTNPFGAGKWNRGEYSDELRDKEVVILPDNDEPGRQHGEQVKNALTGKARSVLIVNLPIGEKGDVADWIDAGGTVEQLEGLVEDARKVTATTPAPTASATPPVSGNPETINPPAFSEKPYVFHGGGIWFFKTVNGGKVSERLANFEAQIIHDNLIDDGVDQTRSYTLEARLAESQQLIDVTSKEFAGGMSWVSEKLGPRAIIYPGKETHVRVAIQELSEQISQRHIYSHTGWTRIGDENYYLHTRGALGASGNRTDVSTVLPKELSAFYFPDPPNDEALRRAAIRESLSVLDVAPDRITFPLLAATFRAAIGDGRISLHIVGAQQGGKSCLAALAQQHFGQEMNERNLPTSWNNSGGANAAIAFHAKDSILVIDDYRPPSDKNKCSRKEDEADFLFRSSYNNSGRATLQTDHRLKSAKQPRAGLCSTGEEPIGGTSLNSRMVVLPFPKGSMNWPRLTRLQRAASRGELATAMACFIQHLAPQLEAVQQRVKTELLKLRQANKRDEVDNRSLENLAQLAFSLNVFLEFAVECKAINAQDLQRLKSRAARAFVEVEKFEAEKRSDNNPMLNFFRSLHAAMQMKKAHLNSKDGRRPHPEIPFGWSRRDGVDTANGTTVGWVELDNQESPQPEFIYLDPNTVLRIVGPIAAEQGGPVPTTGHSLSRDLKEEGWLHRSESKRGTATVRRTLEGQPREVYMIAYAKFLTAALAVPDKPDKPDNSISLPLDEKEKVER